MTEQLRVSFVLDTASAKQAAQQYQGSLDRIAASAQKAGKAQSDVDKTLARTPRTVKSARDSFLDLGRGVDSLRRTAPQAATSMRAIAREADRAGKQARQSGAGMRQFATQTGAAGSVFGQFLSTVGGSSQAAQSVSLLASSSSQLVGAVNPLVLVATAAGAALTAYAVEALSAESATERLASEALEAQRRFTNLGDAISNAGSAFAKVGDLRSGNAIAKSDTDRLEQLLEVREALSDAATQLERDRARVLKDDPFGGFDLNVEQIRELGNLLGKRSTFFQELEVAAGDFGKSSERAIANLKAEIGLRKEGELLVLDSVKAQKLLAEEYRTVETAIRQVESALRSQREFDSETGFREILAALEQRAELEKLGAAERAASILVSEKQAEVGRELTDVEQALADRIIATARAEDERVESAKRLAEREAERQRQAEARAALERQELERQRSAREQFRALLEQTDRQIALLSVEAEQRQVLSKRLDLEASARKALGEINKETAATIDNLVERYEAALESQQKETESVEATTSALLEQNEARDELFRRLEEERELLRLTGEERERYETQLAARREGSSAGLEGAELQDYTRARTELEELRKAQEAATRAGEDLGNALGNALEDFIFDGKKAKDVLRDLFDDLSRQAFRRLVTQQLANLLGGIGGGVAGGAGGAGGGGTAIPGFGVTVSGGFNLSGGVIPAQAGRVLTEPTFFQRAGKMYSAAEGARSTPEAIVPLQRDSKGRLGVASSGGGSPTININIKAPMNKQQAWSAGMTVGQQVKAALATVNIHPHGRHGIRP